MRGVLPLAPTLAPTLALAIAAIQPAAAASLSPPIAPAASGEMQCLAPNTLNKTCQSIDAFKLNAKGGIDNTAMLLVSQSPVVIMTTHTQVVVRDNQVCSPMRPEDIGNAIFSVDGKPATDDQANTFRAVLQAAMVTSFGREVCTAYLPGSNGLSTQVTVNGMVQPGSQRVIWVAPGDGYKVAP